MVAAESPASERIVPHPRTLRKAREQVNCMVTDGVSLPKIRQYLYRWVCWWAKTSGAWKREELIDWYLRSCWDSRTAAIGAAVIQHYFTELPGWSVSAAGLASA